MEVPRVSTNFRRLTDEVWKDGVDPMNTAANRTYRNPGMLHRTMLFVIALVTFQSCSDQGSVEERLFVSSLFPSPGAVSVDKARAVLVTFSQPVPRSQAMKIQIRNAGTGENIEYGMGWSDLPMPAVSSYWPLDATPWKPGSTIEVSIPADIADRNGRTLGRAIDFSFSVAIDSVPFAIVSSEPSQNDTISLDTTARVFGTLTFSDYVYVPDSVLTISPAVKLNIVRLAVVTEKARTSGTASYLVKQCWFLLEGVQPGTRYDLKVPSSVHDYEGEKLAGDYHLVFYTKQ